jgi:hypothetical protein
MQSSNTPAAPPSPRTRRAARRARPMSQPLARDERLPLLRLERAITQRLADHEVRESCAALSAYLDAIGAGDRVLVLGGVL